MKVFASFFKRSALVLFCKKNQKTFIPKSQSEPSKLVGPFFKMTHQP